MENPEKIIREQLEYVARLRAEYPRAEFKYQSYEELTLREGRLFYPNPKQPLDSFKARLCYRSSYEYIKKNRTKMAYTEGYALPETGLVVPHAWLTDGWGHAVDLTWQPAGLIYFGICFPSDWVKSRIKQRWERKVYNYSLLEGDYVDDYVILREGIPKEAKTLTQAKYDTQIKVKALIK